ncbi:MAG: formimidoylglutamase [Bacteriovoracaceae bacterium]|nr:formimidoylglutamase [Bacteriovoracaceae bacterium]
MRPKTLKINLDTLRSDPRLVQEWKSLEWNSALTLPPFSKSLKQVAIIGHPDDEGVRLNNGREGAAEGPSRLLYYLGRMVHRTKETPPILIISDSISRPSLESRHIETEKRVRHLLKLNCRVITFGGGHDYGFPDASAYYQTCKGKVLNVDAHLDVRPVLEGRLTSGTTFFRFIQKFGGRSLIEWGIQDQCNAISHRNFARKSGAKILDSKSKMPKISGPVGLSLCLDAFKGIRGVSAPCFVGLDPEQGVEVVDAYKKKSQWLGIYECAPKYDPINEDSARFGALLAYRFIHQNL